MWIVSSHALIGGVSEARAVDVVLRLIRAQGRVVRREARTPTILPEFDGVESEADMFNQLLVGHHHGVQCSGAFRALSSE
eukprot:CAMPEP_0194478644 /NCGR_PEP_ID=MMETSP0253-20130528/2020_1 /TAXON_ID=2966 /ORGANISM="Noctiluca scintillans" /LENGTH=79 /DNA_ID=CAMNT_0039317759 /DNA_START=591 /DNA_END=830 /DNA_ORIENTATION=-